MRSGVAIIVFAGLAILTTMLVIWRGDKNMSMRHDDTHASTGLPPADTHISGKFQTATFAIG